MSPSIPLSSTNFWCAKHCLQSAGALQGTTCCSADCTGDRHPSSRAPRHVMRPVCRQLSPQGHRLLLQQLPAALGHRFRHTRPDAGVGDCTCTPHASAAASSATGQQVLAGWPSQPAMLHCTALMLTCQPRCIQAGHQSGELGVGQHWRVCQEGATREGVVCGGLLQGAPGSRGTWQGREGRMSTHVSMKVPVQSVAFLKSTFAAV